MTTMCKTATAALALLLLTAAAPAVDKEAIDRSVQGGVQALRREQKAEGNWSNFQDVGMTSLAALALLECNVEPNDPAVKLAAKFVRTRSIEERQTYSIALAILLLDRLGEPVDVALLESLTVRLMGGQLRDGAWSYTCPSPSRAESERLGKAVKDSTELKGQRHLPKPDEKRTVKDLAPEIQEQLQHLGEGNPPGVDPNTGGDNSNTQFATLALWVARRHGLPVEPCLARVEQRFRGTQNRDGGWPYNLNGSKDTIATMTGAGVLCLAIVDGTISDLNRARDPKAPGLDAKKDNNLAMGLRVLGAVIDQPAAVKRAHGLPARIPQVGGKTFYFLWTLERVCVALDLKALAGKDWYDWGAEVLLANQQQDGNWKGDYATADTCFALLFLRRANLAGDLTVSLKGKVADETTLKTGGDFKGSIKGPLEEKTDSNSPPKALDEKTEQGKLAKEIVQASGAKQQQLIEKYRDTKGVAYTEAMVTAIGNLSGEARSKARDALAERVARMTPKTLTNYLKDEEPEIRRAAALGCYLKDSREHIPQLIELLRDKDAGVRQDVLTALKKFSKQNFGPAANATDAERDKAIAAWQEWWKKQAK